MAEPTVSEVLFENIDGAQQITEIESLCMNCHDNGTTRLLLTKIPHFKEVVIMAFECSHCGFKNNEVQPASCIGEMGVHQVCDISTHDDLNRQVVKSEYATVRFQELDFEIPSSTQRGILSTVDGLIDRAIDGLSQDQTLRRIQHPDLAIQIDGVIEILKGYVDGKQFTLSLDDPTGNSYIENLNAPAPDSKIITSHYRRTKDQNEALGLQEEELPLNQQVHAFAGNCSRCNAPCETRMHMLDIPHFKEVIIMCTVCDGCGYKSNEVKAGGAVAPKGQRITLKMTDQEDLNRDILKSETCGLRIPEIDLELGTGTLGGRFTTIEGLLSQVKEELESKSSFSGDSSTTDTKTKFKVFLEKLDSVLRMDAPCTLILDDPLANSHVQNLFAPDVDPNLTIEDYERTFEQNEDFGLNDMVVDNYETQGNVESFTKEETA